MFISQYVKHYLLSIKAFNNRISSTINLEKLNRIVKKCTAKIWRVTKTCPAYDISLKLYYLKLFSGIFHMYMCY